MYGDRRSMFDLLTTSIYDLDASHFLGAKILKIWQQKWKRRKKKANCQWPTSKENGEAQYHSTFFTQHFSTTSDACPDIEDRTVYERGYLMDETTGALYICMVASDE